MPVWKLSQQTVAYSIPTDFIKIGLTDQWVWLHGTGRSFFVGPFVSSLAWAGWSRAGWRQMEELGLVLLGRGPWERIPHPLHWVLPYCLLTMCLCQENALITYVHNNYKYRRNVLLRTQTPRSVAQQEMSDFRYSCWYLHDYASCF